MAASLQLYEQSALNFLQTCTIVFSPIAQQLNATVQSAGGAVDQTDPTTWKYYMNLAGLYHSTDTMMTIASLDTRQTVNFTTAMLAANPVTKAAYVVGSSYYTALCQTYPNQIDLIKSIVYPVDIEAAITAADFTLLGWGDGYLEATEQDAILYELNSFITYATTRWYLAFLSYEAYYVWTFWATLWQTLPNAIFAARLKYLHTSYVHSFHIWSYLESNGIGDYSDILTRQQAMFLYRNINYLKDNRGKQSNLILLVNHLLDTVNVGLVGKTVYMNTATSAAACTWTPEFVSNIIPTMNSQSLTILPPESMASLNIDLIAAGLEVDATIAFVTQEQTKISETTLNILPTKLVEIQKLGVDQKYGGILNNFILDTLVSMITTGRYTPSVVITDPTTQMAFVLNGKDALALYYYAIQRSHREQPTTLPTLYTPSCAFRYDITDSVFPTMFAINGISYPTRSYLSVDDIIAGIAYPTLTVFNPTDFADLVADLFLVLVRNIRYSRTETGQIALEMFLNYCENHLLQTTPYTFSLGSIPDYATWTTSVELSGLFTKLDALVDYAAAYDSLSLAVATALIPETNPVFTFFAYTSTDTDTLYDRLKSLFVQLCSYNIAFLDTSRTNTWWFLLEHVVVAIHAITEQQDVTLEYSSDVPRPVGIDLTPFNTTLETLQCDITEAGDILIPVEDDAMVSFVSQTSTITVTCPISWDSAVSNQNDTVIIPGGLLLRAAIFTDTTSGVT